MKTLKALTGLILLSAAAGAVVGGAVGFLVYLMTKMV